MKDCFNCDHWEGCSGLECNEPEEPLTAECVCCGVEVEVDEEIHRDFVCEDCYQYFILEAQEEYAAEFDTDGETKGMTKAELAEWCDADSSHFCDWLVEKGYTR